MIGALVRNGGLLTPPLALYAIAELLCHNSRLQRSRKKVGLIIEAIRAFERASNAPLAHKCAG
jgi:hypothetical protein